MCDTRSMALMSYSVSLKSFSAHKHLKSVHDEPAHHKSFSNSFDEAII
jgi:hypothetical protein